MRGVLRNKRQAVNERRGRKQGVNRRQRLWAETCG
jgi:hypothetical protein